MPPDLNPEVIAAAGRHDAEGLTGRKPPARPNSYCTAPMSSSDWRASAGSNSLSIPLTASRVSARDASSELAGGSDEIRTFTRVKDERVSVRANDGGQQ